MADDATPFEALSVPPDAVEHGGIEVLRAAVVDGAVSFALRRSFDDPATYAMISASRTTVRVTSSISAISRSGGKRSPGL